MEITFDSYARKFETEIKISLGIIARYCGKGRIVNKKLHFCRNSRLSKSWARCCFNDFEGKRCLGTDTIEFSDFIYSFDRKYLLNIFVHEILHSVCGFSVGHKGEWLYFANVINAHTDLQIQEYVLEEEKEMVRAKGGKKYKYEIYCNTCEKNVGNYARRTNFMSHLSLCSCNTCHTSNLTLIQNY